MVCVVKTVAFSGIKALEVEVQVSIGPGLPGIVIVGLPDKAVNESYVIQYGNTKLKVKYVNPIGRYTQVFLTNYD